MRKVTVIDDTGAEQVYLLEDAPTILAAFEKAGYDYPHGCRVGVCGACLSQVVAGIERLPPKDEREAERLAEFQQDEASSAESRNRSSGRLLSETVRLPCRTPLTGDITLRPLSGSVWALPKK